MEEKESLIFYEGLYVIHKLWLIAAIVLFSVSTVLAIFSIFKFYIPIIVLAVYFVLYITINYLGKKSFRKIEITNKGITIIKKSYSAFYSWQDMSFIEVQNGKFINAFFTAEFLNWIFKMSYLDITLYSEYETITPILIKDREKVFLDKIGIKYY